MKKFLLTAVCAIGCSSLFADTESYLYWMIGNEPYVYGAGGSVSSLSGYKVQVYGGGLADDKLLNLYYAPDGTGTPDVKEMAAGDAQGWGLYAVVPDTLDASASIFVELLNAADDKFMGIANLGTFGDLSNYIASFSGMDTPVVSAKTINSFTIPEPTSGLLMLFGCAALALRRRKMIKA